MKWLHQFAQWLLAVTSALGGFGLFVVAFLDSSVLTFPVANDLIVIQLSIQNPERMPYYVTMATLGSLAGCLLLYYLARKGGEAYFRKHVGGRAERIRRWFDRNAFLAVAIPSILPPPMPFKAFVIAAGVFQVRRRIFIAALVVGRGFRYLAEGFLAVRYGADAVRYLSEHKLLLTAIIAAFILASYFVSRLFLGNGSKEVKT